MPTQDQLPNPGRKRKVSRRLKRAYRITGRYLTADFRSLPDFVIIGTQRGGTTSLYRWLNDHPLVDPSMKKEVHFFDHHFSKGTRWYKAHFPVRRHGKITGESSPYMLFHPLAPARAARVLPEETRFIVVLREPVQRAISNYWHWKQKKIWETESLERAIELEPERLAPEQERVLRGERSVEHIAFSYVSRGEYAPQLRRWFDAVGRDRILVIESEKLYVDPATSELVLDWLGLPPHDRPFPVTNGAFRQEEASPELMARLHEHFEPYNRELFELLGRELWTDPPSGPEAPAPGEV